MLPRSGLNLLHFVISYRRSAPGQTALLVECFVLFFSYEGGEVEGHEQTGKPPCTLNRKPGRTGQALGKDSKEVANAK